MTLPNGLRLLIRRDASAPVVAVVTFVRAGYFDEADDVVGIAHVLEHMYFKGTPSRGVGEIARETKSAGGYLNAGTIYDHTSYYTVLPSASLVQGLEIQADAFANSLIDAAELVRELEVIIQEAKRKADSPSPVTIETLYELLHDRHRMRRWRIGHESRLRALTRDDVLRFYRNFYRPANTILVIVGDVDESVAVRHVERLYGSLPAGEGERAPGPSEDSKLDFRYRELDGDISHTHVAFGWRTPGTAHPDTPLLDLAAAVLGAGRASRLYRAVRDRSLAASISAQNYTPLELGVFSVHAEGPAETAMSAARAAWDQIRDLRQAGTGRDELWRSRRIFESRWIRRLETMEGQASYLAEWEAEGHWTLGDRYLERLLTAAPEQVTEVVRRYLGPAHCGVVAYRPRQRPRLATDAHQLLKLLEATRPEPLPVPAPQHAAPPPALRATPSLEKQEGKVWVYRTTRGIPVLVRRKPGAPLVHIGVFAVGGASDEEPSVAGLTLMLSRTAIKGTERRSASQIAEDAELLGGSISVSVGSESFGWSLSVPTAHALAALELLSDVVQHPVVPESVLATERTVAIADLAIVRDDMYRYPLRLLTQAAFAGHPYGIHASGTEESLARIDAEIVRSWHGCKVLNTAGAIVIVGDVDPGEIAAAASRCFNEQRPCEAPNISAPCWPAAAVSVSELRDKAQTGLALAFPAPALADTDRYAATLVAGVTSGLGGRFFDQLRDRQSLAYTVQSFAATRRAAGIFVTYIATSPEKEEVAKQGLLSEFAKLRDEPVSDEELSRAQAYAIGTHAIRQQSGAAVLADLVEAWLLGTGLAELEMHDARVRAVTTRSMQELAFRYFDESRVVEAAVRGVGRAV